MKDLQRRVPRKLNKHNRPVYIWDLVIKPWDDERDCMKEFCKGKARLIEELLIETFTKYKIPFYKFADNRFNSNTTLKNKSARKKSPVSVMDAENVSKPQGKFAALYDSDDE